MFGYLMIERLARDESGEVTIGWIVITAAIIGMSVAVLTEIGDGTFFAESLDVVQPAGVAIWIIALKIR